MDHIPYIYTPDKSVEACDEALEYIEREGLKTKIEKIGLVYRSVGDLIPQTARSLWSGHFFPWTESWEELQISYNLALFGLYKQSMMSLRSGLELGLLSVYWNLNDEGHEAIQDWLHSNEDTPWKTDIWEKLSQHENFRFVSERYSLKDRILDLGYLDDWVHSKGHEYSNKLGMLTSNFQTFEERGLHTWLDGYEEIVKVLTLCHLIKYPIGAVKYDWSQKFGYDKPMFGGLDPYQVEAIQDLLEEEAFRIVEKLANRDSKVDELMNWVESKPDITEEEKEEQLVNWEKEKIKQQGFEKWLPEEEETIEKHGEITQRWKERVNRLRGWAKENGYYENPLQRE